MVCQNCTSCRCPSAFCSLNLTKVDCFLRKTREFEVTGSVCPFPFSVCRYRFFRIWSMSLSAVQPGRRSDGIQSPRRLWRPQVRDKILLGTGVVLFSILGWDSDWSPVLICCESMLALPPVSQISGHWPILPEWCHSAAETAWVMRVYFPLSVDCQCSSLSFLFSCCLLWGYPGFLLCILLKKFNIMSVSWACWEWSPSLTLNSPDTWSFIWFVCSVGLSWTWEVMILQHCAVWWLPTREVWVGQCVCMSEVRKNRHCAGSQYLQRDRDWP